MKKILFLLSGLFFCQLYSQQAGITEIESTVKEVTVFIDGAQVYRAKQVDVPSGKSMLKFLNLSPFIDARSIQVKTDDQVMVMNVNHQQNFLDKSRKSDELISLEKKLDELNAKINLETTLVLVLQEEMKFLQENRNIGGRDQEVSVTNLKEAAAFYGSRLKELKMDEIAGNQGIQKLIRERDDIQSQINTLTTKREFPTGEILVEIQAEKAMKANFEISYMVGNAGWFPSYDLRAKNISEPVEIIYKANVRQDTKEDWMNVRLKLSSSDPNVSGIAPELKPYFLGYNMLPPVYRSSVSSVSGKVLDMNGSPIPGANILVEGTTIGTVSDMNGNYSLTIPPNASNLQFSMIGYENQVLPVTGRNMNAFLAESMVSLDEVVVTGFGASKKGLMRESLQGRASGMAVTATKMAVDYEADTGIPVAGVENQTSLEFEINIPWTIKSDGRNYSVEMVRYNLPASFQYYSVPKIDKDAFLIAGIVDWEKYNLLEGEANIFFEGTFVGKTILDVRYASDTLNISLGRDKNVSVQREKLKDFTDRQFIGTKKVETRAWQTIVKNNKSMEINMMILDQVPVSTLEEIEVEVLKTSGGNLNSQTGEVKWIFKLKPTEQKDIELKYAVKYPKNKTLIID